MDWGGLFNTVSTAVDTASQIVEAGAKAYGQINAAVQQANQPAQQVITQPPAFQGQQTYGAAPRDNTPLYLGGAALLALLLLKK